MKKKIHHRKRRKKIRIRFQSLEVPCYKVSGGRELQCQERQRLKDNLRDRERRGEGGSRSQEREERGEIGG